VVAQALKTHLETNSLINEQPESTKRFFVSDYTPSFEASTRLFFGEVVHLEQHRLWN